MDESRRAWRTARSASRGLYRSAPLPHRSAFELFRPRVPRCGKEPRSANVAPSRISRDEIPVPSADKRIPGGRIVRRVQVRAGCAVEPGPGVRWDTKGPHIFALAEVIAEAS